MKHLTFSQAVTYLRDHLNLDVTQSYLYRQSSLGRITFFRLGKNKVCTEADLLAFVEDQRIKALHKADQANKQPVVHRREAYRPREIDDDIRRRVTGKP